MANALLTEVFRLKNRKDIDSYVSDISIKVKNNEIYFPLYNYLEAMHLYNMYLDALDSEEVEGYLYPYKLQKIIEIANSLADKPIFSRVNRLYVYSGSVKTKELDGILDVLIKYANGNFLIKLLNATLPIIKSVSVLENLYVSIAIMRYKGIKIPPKIGQYYTEEYLQICSKEKFYPEARRKLKKFIALEQLPKKAKAMYFQLSTLYKALEEATIFDFGVLSLQCFKIIEITTKDILIKGFSNLTDQEIYNILPSDLKDKYNEETFKLERLEIGRIHYLLNQAKLSNDPLSSKLKEIFKTEELLDSYIEYITPQNVNKYRNAPAHGEYLPQEVADEALKLLDSFINEVLYSFNKL